MAIRKEPYIGIGTLVTPVSASTFAFPALAGRPLVTGDAGVLGQGICEIEGYTGRVRSSASASVITRWAQSACGIGRDTQIAPGAGTERSDGEDNRPAAQTGKTYLRELTDEQTGVSLAYALYGARQPGKRFKHEATELKAVVPLPDSGWLPHANLGSQYSHTAKNYSTIGGLAAERPGAVGPVDLMAEIIGNDRTAPWVQALPVGRSYPNVVTWTARGAYRPTTPSPNKSPWGSGSHIERFQSRTG